VTYSRYGKMVGSGELGRSFVSRSGVVLLARPNGCIQIGRNAVAVNCYFTWIYEGIEKAEM
jgi:hypothetical protein